MAKEIGNTIPVAGSPATKKVHTWNEEFIVRYHSSIIFELE